MRIARDGGCRQVKIKAVIPKSLGGLVGVPSGSFENGLPGPSKQHPPSSGNANFVSHLEKRDMADGASHADTWRSGLIHGPRAPFRPARVTVRSVRSVPTWRWMRRRICSATRSSPSQQRPCGRGGPGGHRAGPVPQVGDVRQRAQPPGSMQPEAQAVGGRACLKSAKRSRAAAHGRLPGRRAPRATTLFS